MRRSKVNERIRHAIAFFRTHRFALPPFAYWSLENWSDHASRGRIGEIVEHRLGWDVTDFGQGRFDQVGLVLFTLRNGSIDDLRHGGGRPYAEKVMVVGVGQVTPMHHHWSKTEDIINRGGGRLMVEVHSVGDREALGTGDVTFLTDGVERTVAAGTVVSLKPGESITLTPDIYHSFWAEDDDVLAGEVSTVNDDALDNCFAAEIGRFPEIEEDEAPQHLLVSDYDRFLRGH